MKIRYLTPKIGETKVSIKTIEHVVYLWISMDVKKKDILSTAYT